MFDSLSSIQCNLIYQKRKKIIIHIVHNQDNGKIQNFISFIVQKVALYVVVPLKHSILSLLIKITSNVLGYIK